jgi:integrase
LPAGATRADALALETRLVRQRIALATGQGEYTLDDAIDRWMIDAQGLKSWPRDLAYREPILRQYSAGRRLDELPAVADKLKAQGVKAGVKASTINRYLSLLRRVGNLAERWGWTDQPIGRRVVLLPEHSQRHVYLTPEQVRRLADCADPLTGDMIWFAALTGLRRGEMLGLRREQIVGPLIALDATTKSGRPRGVPLPPEATRIAQERIPWRVAYWELRDRFEAARKAAGMPNVRWHDLRHTYASWLVQAGQPLGAVRELLGHSSLAVTSRYAHLSPDHLRDAVAALPRRVNHGSATKRRKRAP